MDPAKPPRRHRIRRGVAIAAALFVFWLFFVWPPPIWYAFSFPRETASQTMRRHADPVGAEKRRYQPVRLAQMAPAIRRAVLVSEDHRFYDHEGFDLIELRKALGYSRDSFDLFDARDRAEMQRGLARTSQRSRSARRQHDHAAARQDLYSHRREIRSQVEDAARLRSRSG